ncbi:hypothetical protein [Anaeromyxobacter paludicola]|uniref:Uncharacterized protein n=1 Tax=Anaeromyxobacter paludicola TaxID=2918171 RepID=A0ABM7XFD4_9BACT|nr:hypothetical protein [Anaeromyxobacter paludicola]BDG10576.1 hypothetical protein AMPC_36890 [Anaeromyxobacter paludicola]
MTEELRVPKRKVPVEVGLSGGGTRRVAVFLAEYASHHTGAERLGDLLNGEGEFIPALDEEAKAMTFVNRAGVAFARVSRAVEAGGDGELTIPTEHTVEVALVDGRTLRGLVSYVLPPERSRLVDYLNDGPPFFPLLEADAVVLVNRRLVSRVVALRDP